MINEIRIVISGTPLSEGPVPLSKITQVYVMVLNR